MNSHRNPFLEKPFLKTALILFGKGLQEKNIPDELRKLNPAWDTTENILKKDFHRAADWFHVDNTRELFFIMLTSEEITVRDLQNWS